MLNLINDILDLGRVQSEAHELELKDVSVVEIIESSINTVKHMATPKGIKIDFDNKTGLDPKINADKNALIRIFNNLLSNAIKFTPSDGLVNQKIELVDGHLEISVKDSGIGIPEDKIPFLFDKFSKASRVGTSGEKSTGLGLSITKELIERHNGKIVVESEENKGTCFKVILPYHHENEDDETKPVPKSKSKAPSQLKIMVVDDNALNVKLALTVLSRKGYDVESANDGQQAVELYKKSIDNGTSCFDLIFMDIRMPVLDGFTATEQIRSFENTNNLCPTPIIAMTAGTDESWKEKSKEMGLNGIITKPINLKQIESSIRQVIHIDKD